LRNDAPASGLSRYLIGNRKSSTQPDGVNWLWFNFYSPHELVEMRIDGQIVAASSQTEFGLHVYHRYLAVPPQGSAVVQLTLRGRLAANETYRSGWFQQPLVHPDQVRVAVRPMGTWRFEGAPVDAAGAAVTEGDGRTDGHIALPARRTG
jgi:hypothetical protein